MPGATKQLASASLSAQYDPDTQECIVTFAANGQDYTHSGLPPDLWAQWEKAPSKGRFYTQRVRGIY